jgi:hypothetical protein
MNTILLYVALFFVIAFVVYHAVVVDVLRSSFCRIVDYYYRVDRESWEESGRPRGTTIPREEYRFVSTDLTAPYLIREWVRQPPEWALHQPQLLFLFERMRRAYWALWIGVWTGLLVFTAFVVVLLPR